MKQVLYREKWQKLQPEYLAQIYAIYPSQSTGVPSEKLLAILDLIGLPSMSTVRKALATFDKVYCPPPWGIPPSFEKDLISTINQFPHWKDF